MSFVYANPGSGPSAGGIGWYDFNNLVISPGNSFTGLTGTLADGSTVTFDLSLTPISGAPHTFRAAAVPIQNFGFGTAGYTGLSGKPSLYSDFNVSGVGTNEFKISNIVVKDSVGNPISNYTVVLADAETTNIGEVWNFQSNAGNFSLLATLGSNPPTLTGIGTQNVTITGTTLFPQVAAADYVVAAQSPTNLLLTSTESNSGRQAFAIGFAVNKIKLQKYIGKRIDSNDQFTLDISGIPSNTSSTSGNSTGLQSADAEIWAIPGNPYVISETMSPGSGSVLSDYMVLTAAINTTPDGTTPPTGTLPITFTPAIGDDVTYTILNAAPHIFTKQVDKAFADFGEILTYTVTIYNPNDYAVNNVLMTDSTPTGTTYVGNLIVSAPYTGTAPASGITITTIAANSSVTISWQVQVNSDLPVVTPISNIATVIVPGGTSGDSNVVTTQVRHADLKSSGNFIKSVDKAFAAFGETLTYTLTLHNTGNVTANQVKITDALPTDAAYVPNSISASVPFSGDPTGTILLTGPIPAGGIVTITFQVKLNNSAPQVNPVPNTAFADYTYTVDPADPNGTSDTTTSNTVTTQVSAAKLKITKSSDKTIAYLGDFITYSFAIKNTGNVSANHVVLSDVLPNGVTYLPGSLTASVPYSNIPPADIVFTNAVAPGETVTLSFQVKVTSMPSPNPLVNQGRTDYTYTVFPNFPNGVSDHSVSNIVRTTVFRYPYDRPITDIIQSVAHEEAALANLANAEGAKIQAMVARGDITTQQLLCLNKSVADMTDSISILESELKQKLSALNCQINGSCR